MTRDQHLTEMMGKCWHNWVIMSFAGSSGYVCDKCGTVQSPFNKNPNYSTSPADILALQQFVMAQEWWGGFLRFADKQWWKEKPSWKDAVNQPQFIKWLFSDPDRFANLVAECRGWKDE